MLTDNQMLQIAKKYILFMNPENEFILIEENIIKKTYGNIFMYNHRKFIEDGIEKYALAGNAPFLVEKETSRLVVFGTSQSLEYYINAYENNSLDLSSTRYWYPNTKTYSHK